MAMSLEGPVDGSDVKAEEGAFLKLGLLEGEDEGDHVGSEVGPAARWQALHAHYVRNIHLSFLLSIVSTHSFPPKSL